MNFKISISFVLLAFISCKNIQNSKAKKEESKVIQSLLDKSKVNGVILIYDSNKNTYYSNNFNKAKQSSIPASTYKIPHSIIALEIGELKDEKTLFKWDGKKRAFSIWEQNLTLKQAFRKSCVPCYQELARKIGVKRMKENLVKLSFGRMYFDDKTIDNFWLVGKSEISPFEQIDFLQRFYNRKLNISDSTYNTVKNILKIKEYNNFVLSGKTGLGILPNNNIGWFVGYIEKKNNTFYFATKVSPKNKEISLNKFIQVREKITLSAFKQLNLIK